MEARAEDLLPVEYFHIVFTMPAEIARIAYWNQKAVYGLLFCASAETVVTIAADPTRLGAKVGTTSVLHTWGSALAHHPHVHMIVPGGGLSPDGRNWIACKPGFFLQVRVLSRLFRRLFIEGLLTLHRAGELSFFSDLSGLSEAQAFAAYLVPMRKRGLGRKFSLAEREFKLGFEGLHRFVEGLPLSKVHESKLHPETPRLPLRSTLRRSSCSCLFLRRPDPSSGSGSVLA